MSSRLLGECYGVYLCITPVLGDGGVALLRGRTGDAGHCHAGAWVVGGHPASLRRAITHHRQSATNNKHVKYSFYNLHTDGTVVTNSLFQTKKHQNMPRQEYRMPSFPRHFGPSLNSSYLTLYPNTYLKCVRFRITVFRWQRPKCMTRLIYFQYCTMHLSGSYYRLDVQINTSHRLTN